MEVAIVYFYPLTLVKHQPLFRYAAIFVAHI
jgi:hypothetical protein